MYEKICVALGQSALPRRALEHAAELGQALGAELRTRTLETRSAEQARQARSLEMLPPGYRDDLVPDSIAPAGDDGLTGWAADTAAGKGLTVQHQRLEGRPIDALVDDIAAGTPDLLVVGAVNDGEQDDQAVGPLVERLVRKAHVDTLVVKELDPDVDERDTILVCIDGSHQSYAGLKTAFALARTLDKKVEAVGVYDPYIHYTLFNGIVKVLTAEASKVFKFKDQEKLHEEIIDTGLAKIYQAHLEVAKKVAEDEGADLKITLLDGKAFRKVLQTVRKLQPWLLVAGRIGVHSKPDMDIGGATENLLRTVPCNMLVVSDTFIPPVDVQAHASVEWTPDALEKMKRVPDFVKGVATTAIVRWAIERGHSMISVSVINSAMGDLLPPSAAQAMGYVAEEVAIQSDNLLEGKTFICPECGYAAKDFRPVACPVCKTEGASFDQIDREVLEKLSPLDRGEALEEETFDGTKLSWGKGAMEIMRRVPSGYERRRAKARVEKTARVRGLSTISRDFALEMVQQDIADTSYLSDKGEALKIELQREEQADDEHARAREGSPISWTDAAWKRILRVPEGFMRDMTREKVEEVAAERGLESVDLGACEDGIAEGRRMMADMLANYKKQ